MSDPESLDNVIRAGHAAITNLNKLAPKLRGIVFPAVIDAAFAVFGLRMASRQALENLKRDLRLAINRSRAFWRGLESVVPKVDAAEELRPLESIGDQLDRMMLVRSRGGRMGPLRNALEDYRARIEDVLARIETEANSKAT